MMTEATDATIETSDDLHPFERAGLGKAPFRYLGEIDQDIRPNGSRFIGEIDGVEITTNPGGTCAYCGTAIIDLYLIASSDGKRFHVGSDCVQRLRGARTLAKVKQDVKRVQKGRQKAREEARIRSAVERLADPLVAERLAAMPHPSGYRDRATGYPLSLANFVGWMLRHGGHSGRLATARVIERALA